MFDRVTTIVGAAAPLPFVNVDTDVIIRIERMTIGDPAQLGHWAFEAWRYLPDGSENSAFPLNRPQWRHAPILIATANFGCGSSREAAVTALLARGIRCVISESFGDIFYANCFQSGLLPVRLAKAEVERLLIDAESSSADFVVDLAECEIRTPAGDRFAFNIDGHRREAMMAGKDDIELTLQSLDEIATWQASDRTAREWAWQVAS